MPLAALLLAADAPPCRPAQLRLSTDVRGGDFDGMSHSGVELSVRNLGQDCTLPALPEVRFLDARARTLPAVRRAPPGMHPGPVMVSVHLGGGHRAATDLRWVSGPVFTQDRALRAAFISVQIGGGVIRTPLKAVLYGEAGGPAYFEQPPLRAKEGLAAE